MIRPGFFWGKRTCLAVLALAAVSCGGGGGGSREKVVPSPLAPGEVITVSLCGSTTQPMSPCANFPDNAIQMRVSGANGLQCPCFNFAFLNQNLTDLGPATTTTYEFTGFRPGTYTVTGAFTSPGLNFTFAHNASTSTIGVVPSSLQSLSGPGSSAQSCLLGYNSGSNLSRTSVAFSFQFTVAATTSGGSC